jgi:hypothetical protein
MTVNDIITIACETTGDISSEALDFARRFLRVKYATLYDAHAWRESKRVIEDIPIDTTQNGSFFLPFDSEETVFVSVSYDGARSYGRLQYRERDWIERFAAGAFALPGVTPWYYRAENLAWPAYNPGRLTFTTSEKSAFNCYIAGKDQSGFPIGESFILQGTINPDGTTGPSTIQTANSYQTVTVLSKQVTSTPLMITPQLGSVGTISISPGVTESVYTQIVFRPPLQPGALVRIEVKLKPDSLDNDMSVPRISHVWEALVSFTTAALWRRLQQVQKAASDNQDAMEHVKAAINIEKNQSEFQQLVVPATYERGDYVRGFDPVTTSNPFAY